MFSITLKDAIYSPFSGETVGKSVKDSAQEIGTALQKHASLIGVDRGHCYASARSHYICSTIMDLPFCTEAMDSTDLMRDGSAASQRFTHAYECACWGYCLKYHLKYKPDDKYVAISIMDVNSMELGYWSASNHWGKSGFGVMTLFFEVADAASGRERLHTGVASGGNNIIAFASVAKQVVKEFEASRLSLPYFPEAMALPMRRAMKGVDLLAEYHGTYGHAFGSDPWISFIRDHAETNLSGKRIVFGSLALRGYYCFADVDIDIGVNVHHF
jgi:hypothetical protein